MSEEKPVEVAENVAVVEADSGGMIANAPWWLVSGGVHVVILLAATLVYVERLMAIDDAGLVVAVTPPSAAVVNEIEKPRDTFERRGIPTDQPNDTDSTEPIIFFPEAEIAKHNESADNEDYGQMKGDSTKFTSYIPGSAGGFRGRQSGNTPGVYDTMGPGGGGGSGGRYGGPYGGRFNRVARGHSTNAATESAVIAALRWLARHQDADGSWKASTFHKQCISGKCSGTGMDDYDTGLTSLSLLAFLGAGFSHLSRDEYVDPVEPSRKLKFGLVVKNAMQWLIAHQDPEGCVGERTPKFMYNHAIAALALSEAYGMTSTQLLKEPAQKAIDFIIASQNPGRGWRYSSRCGENDTSVSGWAIMALKSAELSELAFPRSSYDGMINWLDETTSPNGYYKVGYTARDQGKVFVPNKNEQWDDHPSMTAVAVMARIFMQKKKGDPALGGVHLMAADLPEWKSHRVDFYYWYYASLAMFQYDGPEGGMWKKWKGPMENALVPNQKTAKDQCQNGSWSPEEDRWGFEGGRVYSVAINALTLEVYYRYKNVFVGGGK